MKVFKLHSLRFYLIPLFYGVLLGSHVVAEESSQDSQWTPLQITDVNKLPWDERFRMGHKNTTNGKLLFSKVGEGSLLYVKFNPGWSADGTEAH